MTALGPSTWQSLPVFLLMQDNDAQRQWEEYRARELRGASPVLQKLGVTLEAEQVHTEGERFLMAGERDVGGGGYKLVLLGQRQRDSKRVVIKLSSTRDGRREIETERAARETLRSLRFAYHALLSPEEILFINKGAYTILATEFIDQDKNFLTRSVEEQFSLALRALKAQEGVHATTYSHAQVIRSVFGISGVEEYLRSFKKFAHSTVSNDPDNVALAETLNWAEAFLEAHRDTIEQYSGFLTHADFVPHNLRVRDDDIYLLDSASFHFGNKYESWARLLNFMLLYNRPLERAFIQYVRDNRTPEESLSLRLMRIYKLGKLLEYHAGALSKTSGNMHELSKKRVEFWRAAMYALLVDTPLEESTITEYKNARNSLRSEEEKRRQEALH
ncbi:MAG: hypothetical protein G01um101456_431 [Parcubacteria group bacterium Gr01-1014_56]|nr:MAG: hypothetical protein G01um101456_431 [Parcubacteria group bacterium Gr01-1014_56]